MNAILVRIIVGVGAWKAERTAVFPACPHVGDMLVVGLGTDKERTIVCERVTLFENEVLVEETIRFGSESDAKNYF